MTTRAPRGETSGMPRWTTSPRTLPEQTPEEAFTSIAQTVRERFPDAVERDVQDRGELTLHVTRDRLLDVLTMLRNEPELRFELLSSVSGVDYLGHPDLTDDRRLHAVYHLTSMTHRRRVRVEVAVPADDPHVPSAVSVFPTADWHERETWDFFGIVFDGHPALTRIEMPDDWDGHPQRKDYPLGGVPVEYKGAQIPPPEDRRAWA
jgi:NADH-quinone oxidoreductase subunit C